MTERSGISSVEWIEPSNIGFGVDTPDITYNEFFFQGYSLHELDVRLYLEQHLDNGFEDLLDANYGSMPCTPDILELCYRFYIQCRSSLVRGSSLVREALLLVIAHNLAFHVVLFDHKTCPESLLLGQVRDPRSRYFGQVIAPQAVHHGLKNRFVFEWDGLHQKLLANLKLSFRLILKDGKVDYVLPAVVLSIITLVVWE